MRRWKRQQHKETSSVSLAFTIFASFTIAKAIDILDWIWMLFVLLVFSMLRLVLVVTTFPLFNPLILLINGVVLPIHFQFEVVEEPVKAYFIS